MKTFKILEKLETTSKSCFNELSVKIINPQRFLKGGSKLFLKKIKIIKLVFVAVTLITTVNAQNNYHPLVQEGKMWSILDAEEIYNPDPISAFEYQTTKMLFSGDTTINGVQYKKLYYTTKENPIFPQDWFLQGFMRENEDKKVWYKDKNLSSMEKLYYDFSLEIDDTVPDPWNDRTIIVENITNEIMTNGEERRVFWLSSFYYVPFTSHTEYWIEGIGSIIGLIYPLFGDAIGGFSNLLCFHENEELIFKNQHWNTCYKTGSTIAISDNQIDSKINIYPNPTSGQIIVKTGRATSPHDDASSIQIYDITGRIVDTQFAVYQRNENENEISIDISNLQNGIYFLQINNEIIKFIKN